MFMIKKSRSHVRVLSSIESDVGIWEDIKIQICQSKYFEFCQNMSNILLTWVKRVRLKS